MQATPGQVKYGETSGRLVRTPLQPVKPLRQVCQVVSNNTLTLVVGTVTRAYHTQTSLSIPTIYKDFYTPFFLCTEVVRGGSRGLNHSETVYRYPTHLVPSRFYLPVYTCEELVGCCQQWDNF